MAAFAHLRTFAEGCDNAAMDESVKHFAAEQGRVANEGGPVRMLNRQIRSGIIALGAFAIIAWGLETGLGALPRNANNSVKLVYYGPALALQRRPLFFSFRRTLQSGRLLD